MDKIDKLSALVELMFYGGRKTMRKQSKHIRECDQCCEENERLMCKGKALERKERDV